MTNSICNQAVEERQRKELAVEALNQQVTAVGEWSSVIQSRFPWVHPTKIKHLQFVSSIGSLETCKTDSSFCLPHDGCIALFVGQQIILSRLFPCLKSTLKERLTHAARAHTRQMH